MLGTFSSKPNSGSDDKLTALQPFTFIPLTESEAASGRAAAERLVRAHVTRARHASFRRNLKPSFTRYIPSRPCSVLKKDDCAVNISVVDKVPEDENSALKGRKSCTTVMTKIVTSFTEDSFTRRARLGAAVPRLPSGTQQEDPFWTYPVDYKVSLSPIFAHYIQNVAVEIPDLDGPGQHAVLRRQWFPLAMTEPSTMYAVLLMAASHYHTVDPPKVSSRDLVYLKDRALSEINIAMADPSRALTDAVIGAIMKMAAYEAIFGDVSVYSTHMRGLGLMLRARGGLGQLGLDGVLERLLVWIDLNAAHLTGMARTVGGKDMPTQVQFDGPDLFHFAGVS